MTLVVDITDWLDEHLELPASNLRMRSRALRIARFIEYGGPLESLQARETLVECRRRPDRRQCLGLLWVMKLGDNRIQAFCRDCLNVEAIISGWEATAWAHGVMSPVPITDD